MQSLSQDRDSECQSCPSHVCLQLPRECGFPTLSVDNVWGFFFFFFKILFIYFQRRGKKGKIPVVASHVAPAGDLAHNPGMCPDWESKR